MKTDLAVGRAGMAFHLAEDLHRISWMNQSSLYDRINVVEDMASTIYARVKNDKDIDESDRVKAGLTWDRMFVIQSKFLPRMEVDEAFFEYRLQIEHDINRAKHYCLELIQKYALTTWKHQETAQAESEFMKAYNQEKQEAAP